MKTSSQGVIGGEVMGQKSFTKKTALAQFGGSVWIVTAQLKWMVPERRSRMLTKMW